ncbi:hypothetical protein LTR86_003626 [Recurvomyces mirabilis]|nr:hypothetical protein LTR86_003626 [Recurvomyces mirabilis]
MRLPGEYLIFADWGHPGWLNNSSVQAREQSRGLENTCDDLLLDMEDIDDEWMLDLEREDAEQIGRRAAPTEIRRAKPAQRAAMKTGFVESAQSFDTDSPDGGGLGGASHCTSANGHKRKAGTPETDNKRLKNNTRESFDTSGINWSGLHGLFVSGLENLHIDKATRNQHPKNRKPFTLRPHQREALGWWNHITRLHGCFLFADDMGLGKTSVAVARMETVVMERQGRGELAHFLVVAPLSLLSTWVKELARSNILKVLVFHRGKERSFDLTELKRHHVIVTTYDIVKNMHSTLEEVQEDWIHIRDGRRDLKSDRISVPLLAIDYDELIIDEAHTIRTSTSAKGKALDFVKAKVRVVITGTPLQNSYWDLYPLLRFMRLVPMNDHHTFKSCFVKKWDRKRDKKRRLNLHSELILIAILSAVQLRRLKTDDFDNHPMTGVKHWHEINHAVELCQEAQKTQEPTEGLWQRGWRLAREERPEDIREQINELGGSEDETAAEERMQIMKVAKTSMFRKIHEAKVNCVHPKLKEAKCDETLDIEAEESKAAGRKCDVLDGQRISRHSSDLGAEYLGNASEHSLAQHHGVVAGEEKKSITSEANRKAFKREVAATANGWESDKTLPVVITVIRILRGVEEQARYWPTAALRKEHIARNKVIIFGDYLAANDIIEIGLAKYGYTCLRFDGTCSPEERDRATARFEEEGKDFNDPNTHPDEVRIMLAGTKAAGEGLTWIHATSIVFVGPHWNPFVQLQCISRASRLGQVAQVNVHRFIMDDSIEQHICDINAVKLDLVGGLMESSTIHRYLDDMSGWSEKYLKKCLTKESPQ